jgi:hypothetical protein
MAMGIFSAPQRSKGRRGTTALDGGHGGSISLLGVQVRERERPRRKKGRAPGREEKEEGEAWRHWASPGELLGG